MSYKASKPDAACVLYLNMLYTVMLFIRAPFLFIVSFRCYAFCLLFVLVKLSVPSDWLERSLGGNLSWRADRLQKAQAEDCLWCSYFIVLLLYRWIVSTVILKSWAVNVTLQTFKTTFCKVVADAAALHPVLLTCTLGCSSLTAGW